MNDDLQYMLKKILVYDLIIGLIFNLVLYLISPIWATYFLLGLFVAFISFLINAFITNASFTGEGNASKLFILVGFFIRVILVSVIGIIIYTHNITNMVVYISGYSLQFISIVLYGLTIKK